jgi:transcription initiation factor TFIIF subunit beta
MQSRTQGLYTSDHALQIPKFLLERWTSVNSEDVHLATIRVYTPPSGGKPRFILFLPPNREPPTSNNQEAVNGSPAPSGSPAPPSASQQPNRPAFSFTTSYATTGAEPDCYELDMVNEAVDNQIVVAERPKDSSLSVHGTNSPFNSRARTTILTGRIKHECNLRPSFSENYRKQMRERHIRANTKQRQIRMIEDAGVSGGRGGINRLSSGVGVGSGGAFSDLIVCLSFLSAKLRLTIAIEDKTETLKRIRAHGSYSTKPTFGSTLFSFPRYTTLGSTAIAG